MEENLDVKIERWRILASILFGLAGVFYLVWLVEVHSPRGTREDRMEGFAYGMAYVISWVFILNVGFDIARWTWKRSRLKR